MQLRRVLFIFVFLFNCLFSYGQRPYYNERPEFLKANSIWTLSDSAGLDFNFSPPMPIKSSVSKVFGGVIEGGAAVADPITGKLLFYSEGFRVWNADHEVMPNGDSLKGNGSGDDFGNVQLSTVQGALIVPFIENSSTSENESPEKYYLFSLYGVSSGSMGRNAGIVKAGGALFYSIIDMTLDNGRGDIAPGEKNMVLSSDTLHEGMIAIPGDNCDIWLLVYDFTNSLIKAYNISEKGISQNPVISPLAGGYQAGSLAVSPDRTMIAISDYYQNKGVSISRFNPSNGEVTEGIQISNLYGVYSLCFSPDNTKLYCGGSYGNIFNTTSPAYGSSIAQFDLSNYDSSSIASSILPIDHKWQYRVTGANQALKLYDQQIFANTSYIMGKRIVKIKEPNLRGTACNYDTLDIQDIYSSTVTAATPTYFTLPNEVVFPIPPETSLLSQLSLDTTVCEGESVTLEPHGDYGNYLWNDGSKEASITVTEPGTYYLEQYNGCRYYVDTFIVNLYDFQKPVIRVNVFELSTTQAYNSYQWLFNGSLISGANQRIYTVSENGDYQVITSNGGSCMDTSDIYEVTNAGTGVKNLDVLAGQIKVYPNPVSNILRISSPINVFVSIYSIESKLIKAVENTEEISLEDVADGIYFLKISDQHNNLLKTEKIIKQL